MSLFDLDTVLGFLGDAHSRGVASALVTVCSVEGSSMRNPGTLMAVAEDGSFAGSLSGGCIENAVVTEALEVIQSGAPRIVRFGAGSPYLDIKLPCGGGLDLHFSLVADPAFVEACLASVKEREPFSITLGPGVLKHQSGWQDGRFDLANGAATFGYWPSPMLQIIGHGAGVEALARLARVMGCGVKVLTPDDRIIAELSDQQVKAQRLSRTDETGLIDSDPWTATIFLFHDHDWEIALMEAALEQPHFYIGAMGGRKAHAFRSEALLARGVSEKAIASIHAPIGLFHSSRDPQTLALSTLGEVIRAYEAAEFGDALG
ncbi:MAG: XdhC family protein [Pseudomonadota bacterium]